MTTNDEYPRCAHCRTPLHPQDETTEALADAAYQHLWDCTNLPTTGTKYAIELTPATINNYLNMN